MRKVGSVAAIPTTSSRRAFAAAAKGFFAIRDDGGDDIYIRDHQLNHAWNGDRVLVVDTRGWSTPFSRRWCSVHSRLTLGLLASVEHQDDRLVAVPLDDRLLASIELSPDDAAHAEHDKGLPL